MTVRDGRPEDIVAGIGELQTHLLRLSLGWRVMIDHEGVETGAGLEVCLD